MVHFPKFLRGEVTRYGSQNAAFRSLRTDSHFGYRVLSPKSVLAARLGPERLTLS